ncbi:MAG: ACT domain-containing protein [Chloroflexota bacterium]
MIEEDKKFTLTLYPLSMSICRMPPNAPFPQWVKGIQIIFISHTPDELCVICPEVVLPKGIPGERNWRLLRIEAIFDFSEVGVLYTISKAFADANVSILTISTFDTDYFLIRDKDLERALAALYKAGHRVNILKEK